MHRQSKLTGSVLAAAILGGLLLLGLAITRAGGDDGLTPQPGPAPPGKVWSPEHGHWHDVP